MPDTSAIKVHKNALFVCPVRDPDDLLLGKDATVKRVLELNNMSRRTTSVY
jgi:hypothetical protein